MKYRAHNAKRDLNELQIVKDLLKVGAKVHRLNKPCDLLVRFGFRLYLIEVSNPDYPNRQRDEEQLKFFEDWNVPMVTTSDEALRIIGAT